MRAAVTEITDKINGILGCLEQDIRHIEECLSRLNELRRLVIKRDDISLGRLLENIRAGSEAYRGNESKRQSIRREIAETLGCEVKDVTLSSLEAHLPEAERGRITEAKTKLRALVRELRKEYLSTALLLSECARFNTVLLQSVFKIGRTGVVCYNSNGAKKQQIDASLMDMQF